MNMEVTLLKKKKCKRGIAFLLVLSLMLGMVYVTPGTAREAQAAAWNRYIATSFEAGTGTKDNPYQIRWGSQLALLAQNVAGGETYAGKYFVVTADIQLNDTTGCNSWNNSTTGLAEWKAIGVYESVGSMNNKPFEGTFNGEGHVISGIWSCNRDTNGLFGYNKGVISDIKIEKSYIEGSGYGVGAVAGRNEGTIDGCSTDENVAVVTRWVDSDENMEAGSAGGIVGTNNGTVNHAVNNGKVQGVAVTGGVVGTNAGMVVNSSNEGDIKGSKYGTGGIAGCNSRVGASVTNSYNAGEVSAENYAGGIVGINAGKITNTYNDGKVTISQSAGCKGGIAGTLERSNFDSSGSVAYSYWIGDNKESKDIESVGYLGSGTVDSSNCQPYDFNKVITTEISFTINGESSLTRQLSTLLNNWTQAYEGGKGSDDYLGWEKDNTSGLPVMCDTSSDVWDGSSSSPFGGGDGSKGAPYRITNAAQLKYLEQQVNSGNSYSGKYFVLTKDIELNDVTFKFKEDTGLVEVTCADETAYVGTGIAGDSESSQFKNDPSEVAKWYTRNGSTYEKKENDSYLSIHEWIPIGSASRPFEGMIDGKGYTVKGIFVNNYSCEGLFGYIGGGSVSNLNISDSCYIGSNCQYTGAVTGYIAGDITRCNVESTVVAVKESNYTGGVAGYFADSKTDSAGEYTEENTIFGTGFSGWICSTGYVGGICGYSGKGDRIDECFTKMGAGRDEIIIGNNRAVGGISGRNYGSTIVNTYNEINVSAKKTNKYAGGIAGENMSEGKSYIPGYPAIFGVIANCYNKGTVTGADTDTYTGGIAGHNIGGTIYNSYCEGTVNGAIKNKGGAAGINSKSEGTHIIYEGLTKQQYKECEGIINYCYVAGTEAVYGSESTVKQGEDTCSNFKKSTYDLDTTILGQSNLCSALNRWVQNAGNGFGNDEQFETYLQWTQPNGAYPQFATTHYLTADEEEPLPKYSLIYNPNGNDVVGTMETVVCELTEDDTPDDKKPVVAEVGYTREGYKFAGWNTSPEGDGKQYKPGDTIDIKGTTNLYAIWTSTKVVITEAKKNNGHNVTINWNHVDDASGYWIYRQKAAAGQSFKGFSDADKIGEADADTLSYRDNDLDAGTYYYGVRAYSALEAGVTATYTFMPYSDPKEVEIAIVGITYMDNVPGSTVSDRRECIEGKTSEIIENSFEYTGYAFAGWNTEADGTGTSYTVGESVTVTEDITLYALWKIAPVSTLRGEITSNGTVALTWDRSNVTDIAGYKVYCSVGDDSDYKLIGTVEHDDAVIMVRYRTIEPLSPSTTYHYRVTIFRDSQTSSGMLSEESDYSNEVVITSDSQISLDNTKGLQEGGYYTGINGDKVYLKWEAEDGVTGYEIYRSERAGAGIYGDKLANVIAPNVTYTDTVPKHGTFYYYMRPYTETRGPGNQVSSISFGDYSAALRVDIGSVTIEYNSNVRLGAQRRQQVVGKNFKITLEENTFSNSGFTFMGWNTQADSMGTTYTDKQACSFSENIVLYAVWKINVPVNLAAQILEDKVTLSWDNNYSADGFEIYRQVEQGSFELIGTVEPGKDDYNEYDVLGFDEELTYNFYIRAFVNEVIGQDRFAKSYSDNSEILKVSAADSPDDKVSGVRCVINPDGDDGSKVQVSWREVDDIDGYYVYRSDKQGEAGERIADTQETEYVDETIPDDAPGTYYYTVRAYVRDSDGIYYRTPSNAYRIVFDKVKISYRPNGAEGDEVEKYVIKGAAGVIAEECMFNNPQYEFGEWSAVIDDVESAYLPGQVIPASVLQGNINLNARWKLKAVNIIEIKVNTDSSLTLTWTANDMATGYNIYQKKGNNGMYSMIGSSQELAFTTSVYTDVTSTYHFYVVPYVETQVSQGKLQTEGVPSESRSIIPNPELAIAGQVTGLSVAPDKDKAILSWDIVEDVTGYYIYRSEVKGERGKLIQTVTSNEEYTYTDTEIPKAGTYYYSMRAYIDSSEATYYKEWSQYADVTFEECVITYIANNYTEEAITESYIKGTDINIMANPFVFKGRCFVSWNTDPLGKAYEYTTDEVISLDESIELYAIWKVEKPQHVRATVANDNSSIRIVWDPVVGADGYIVCRKDAHGGDMEERTTTTNTTFTDYNDGKKVTPNDAYYYYVRAYQQIDPDTRRYGDYSDTTVYSVIGDAPVPTQEPVDTVTNLSIIERYKDENKVRIGWSGIPAADGYRVFYSEGKDGEKVFTGFDADASNMITPLLKLDVKYYFYVVAYIIDSITEEYRLSDFSEGLEVLVTSTPMPTPSPTPIPTATPNPYGKIKNVRYDKKSSSSIELKWDELNNMSGYQVYKCSNVNGSGPQKIGSDISGSSLVITDLDETQNHYFYVRGVIIINTEKGEVPDFSDRSDILTVNLATPTPTPQVTNSPSPAPSATPTPKPSESPGIRDSKVSSFVITDAVGSVINLAWDGLEGAEEYEISYSNTPDGEKVVVSRVNAPDNFCKNVDVPDAVFNVRENINVTDVQAYGQTKNAEYYYFVRGVSKGEYSGYSDYVRVVLHTEQLVTPAPEITPTPAPTPTASPGIDKYVVGYQKKIGKLIYRITAKSKSSKTVEVVRPVKKTYKSITIPATVKIGSNEYKVTTVKASAFKKNKKLAKIVFGKNIKKVGRKAFYGDKKLMKVTFRSKNVNSFGKKAFHGITMRCRFIIPKSVLKKYKKLIRKTEG